MPVFDKRSFTHSTQPTPIHMLRHGILFKINFTDTTFAFIEIVQWFPSGKNGFCQTGLTASCIWLQFCQTGLMASCIWLHNAVIGY